jgi:hypothetical protein
VASRERLRNQESLANVPRSFSSGPTIRVPLCKRQVLQSCAELVGVAGQEYAQRNMFIGSEASFVNASKRLLTQVGECREVGREHPLGM